MGSAKLAEAQTPGGLGLLDALRMTLERDPNVALDESRVQSARGSLQTASGRFDPVVSSELTEIQLDEPESASSSQETRILENIFGVAQEFRTGLSFEPRVVLTRTEDVTGGATPDNDATVTFRLRQPLLRGRGRTAVAAEERTAERELEARGLDLRQTLALRVLTVASQYWVVEAAARNLEVLSASETSARELLENTRKLIEADQLPAAELVQLEANVVSKESSRIGGERDLFAARQDLGREIGLDAAEIAGLSLPADPFPDLAPDEVPPLSQAPRFVTEALGRRADLRAARERRTGSEILRRAAATALKPQLDLVFEPRYSGLLTGSDPDDFFSPLFRNVPGPGATVSLNLSWPTFNNRAEGLLVQAEQSERQSDLFVELLAKGIGANVPAALDSVERNTRQLDRAREAVRLFERVVINEEKKLRAGSSTLLDVITQRDRLTAARQSEVLAQLTLAQSILQLRFETGTLLGDEDSLEYARLTTVPFVEEAAP